MSIDIDIDAADVGVWRRKADDAVAPVALLAPATATVPVSSAAETPAVTPGREALAAGPDGTGRLIELLTVALAALDEGTAARGGPIPAGGPHVVAAAVRAALDDRDRGLDGGQDGWSQAADATHTTDAAAATEGDGMSTGVRGSVLPQSGIGAEQALAELTHVLAYGAADPASPGCAAHLQTPVLAVSAVADFVVSVLNPSLDSWDQAPAATALEGEVVAALADLVGYAPSRAGGVLTTGGTESNLMGLLLARDWAVRRYHGLDAGTTGLPAPLDGRLRILCSREAHFSIARSAALLGLGEDAVVRIATDEDHRMDLGALTEALERIQARDEVPAAVVATAGTTDFGAIDPLRRIAEIALDHGAWLHVDAAHGGGALFSDRLAPLMQGIEMADSVGLDLHKFGWQPVAAGVFLTRAAISFAPLERNVSYLNPVDDEEAGYPSLLGRSLRTTRRADAFKVAVTLRALGRAGLGGLVDRCHDCARYAALAIDRHPRLELDAAPVLSSVVFGYRTSNAANAGSAADPADASDSANKADADRVNAALRRRLLAEGRAVVGRTDVADTAHAPSGSRRVRLKLTFLNPATTPSDIDALLEAVVAAGEKEEAC